MDSLTARGALLVELTRSKGYGLELVDRVAARSENRIRLSQANVYSELRSLERDGLARSWEGDPLPERGGRPRRYYELTADGRKAAHEVGSGLALMIRGLVLEAP